MACQHRQSLDTWPAPLTQCQRLLCVHIPNTVNCDGDERSVTKLLTQRDTSSENKLAAQLAWTVGGQLAEEGGRRAATLLIWVVFFVVVVLIFEMAQ